MPQQPGLSNFRVICFRPREGLILVGDQELRGATVSVDEARRQAEEAQDLVLVPFA